MNNIEKAIQEIRNDIDAPNPITLNVVTCGECGGVFAHEMDRLGNDVTELTCPYCKMTSDVCDFPDLFYPPERNDSYITI